MKFFLPSFTKPHSNHLLNNQQTQHQPQRENPQDIRDIQQLQLQGMEVKRRTAKSLISKLSSVSDPTRIAALCEIRTLTKSDPEIRPIIADEEGAIAYLADTLYSSAPLSQESAAATLLNLSISCRESLMSTRGLLDALSHALSNHLHYDPSAVEACAATVYSLLVVEDYRPIIGSKRDLVYALIDIVRNPNSRTRSIKDAVKALFGLSLYPLNRHTMVELGAVPALFGVVVGGGPVGLMEDSTAVIAQVAGCEEALSAFRRVSGIRVLVDLLDPGTGSSFRIRENAVSGLLNLTRCCGEVVGEEIREVGLGLVFDGLGEVAQNGSVKGRKRAEALMKILEDGISVKRLSLEDSGSVSDVNSGSLLDSHSY